MSEEKSKRQIHRVSKKSGPHITLLAPRSDSKIAGSASAYSFHPKFNSSIFIKINKLTCHISIILLRLKDYGRVYCSLVESTVVFSDSLIMTWEN